MTAALMVQGRIQGGAERAGAPPPSTPTPHPNLDNQFENGAKLLYSKVKCTIAVATKSLNLMLVDANLTIGMIL